MQDWIIGMDISSLAEVERCGGKFYDHGHREDALSILKKYGTNLIRLRLWKHPFDEKGRSYGAGGNDLETTLTLAKRAKAVGIPWLLDIHYSDFWADPGKQIPPRDWQGLSLPELIQAVHDYTKEVLAACRREDVLPQLVAVGNELSHGLLWPQGKTPNYPNIARLVNAGIRAVRETDASLPVMLHLDNGGSNALYRTWFDAWFANGGEDFEYIGLSYYPFWHGSVADLRNNLNDLALRYHKKLVVAEVAMGFTLEDYQSYEQLPDEARKGMAAKPALAEHVPFPMSPEGQKQFLQEVIQTVHQAPEGLGCGYIYWEPAWLPVPGSQWATPEACAYMGEKGPGGNEWANQALFDYEGNALPALEVLKS